MKKKLIQRLHRFARKISKVPRVLALGLGALLITACDGAEGPPVGSVASSTSSIAPTSSASTSSELVGNQSSSGSSRSSAAATNEITLSGKVTFDFVPTDFLVTGNISAQYGGNFTYTNVHLDYTAIEVRPARDVTVEILDANDNILASTKTNTSGGFEFTVKENSMVKVRALAKMAADNYAISVQDNTSSDALYLLEGSLASSGDSSTQIRHLHADLGWNGSAYASERQSAPFAILDALHQSLTMVLDADPSITLPPLSVFWSGNNIAVSGDIADGEIGKTHYDKSNNSIYLMGHADNNTDEFDTNVIQHEFAHFIVDKLSRDDSPGGKIMRGVPADLRTAFSEGFANAFAAMSSNFSSYLETNGPGQGAGLGFDVETHDYTYNQIGPANVGAIQLYLFDLFDATPDDYRYIESFDKIELGFGPILEALRSPEYLHFDGVTSIYAFKAALSHVRLQNPFNESRPYGEREMDARTLLPIYQFIKPGEVITKELWTDNKSVHGNFMEGYSNNWATRFVILTVPAAGDYTITLERERRLTTPTNPVVQIFQRGRLLATHQSQISGSNVIHQNLAEGTYLLTIYNTLNFDGDNTTGGREKYSLSVSEGIF